MTKYGRSPWIDQFPKSRVPSYPRHRAPVNIDVAIVGGGLTGCAAAYAFAAAGVKVAVFEAGRIGWGASGSSTGWIADDPGVSFAAAEKAVGRRGARQMWQAWRHASLDFAALLRRLDIKCRLEPRDALQIAVTPEDAALLKREQKARKDAGLETAAVPPGTIAAETALMASAAIRHRQGATVDPYRATVGLAAAATGRGALIFEGSPIQKITFTRKHADVSTSSGITRVKRVVVATGVPTPLHKSLARHFWFHSSFLVLTDPVPRELRNALGTRASLIRDFRTPPHVLRWVDDERLLVAGADSEEVPPRLIDKTIVQRTGQLMYELSTMYPDISGLMPAYGWAASYARTGDGLPFIGPHRNFPHHLFAFGDSSHSVTGAYLASRILLRHHLQQTVAADEAFEFR